MKTQAPFHLAAVNRTVRIDAGTVQLDGELTIPESARGIVILAHGSGSSQHSPRNQSVARALRQSGLGTLLFDLLTRDEEAAEEYTRHLRFNIELLAHRLSHAFEWVRREASDSARVGFFGASTGAAAALVSAAVLGKDVNAVVSRGGRPDLAGEALPRVSAATLLIVGSLDVPVIELNQQACNRLQCEKELRIVPGATHLFEEPGTLAKVADLAAPWFQKHFD
jgi:dienelactone hydrolase